MVLVAGSLITKNSEFTATLAEANGQSICSIDHLFWLDQPSRRRINHHPFNVQKQIDSAAPTLSNLPSFTHQIKSIHHEKTNIQIVCLVLDAVSSPVERGSLCSPPW
jgi:hypothetical protein